MRASCDDGFTVSQDVPLNSWHDFADATKDSLEDRGFEADHVQTHADSDLERQSHRIQDYVAATVVVLVGAGLAPDPQAASGNAMHRHAVAAKSRCVVESLSPRPHR